MLKKPFVLFETNQPDGFMKKLLLPFALTFFSIIVFSQNNTTWFGPGCQWKYTYIGLSGPGEEIFEYAGTETVGGQLCAKLHWHGYHEGFPPGPTEFGFHYFFARNDSVFWWQFNQFVLLYDFTRQVGDTISTTPGNFDLAVVDSIGVDTFPSGLISRFQDVRLVDFENFGDTTVLFTRNYERLGGQHLIYWEPPSPLSEIEYFGPCYRDDEYPQEDCDLSYDPDYAGLPFGQATWSEENTIWCSFTGYQYRMGGDTVIWGVGQGKKLYYRPTYLGSYPCPTAFAEMLQEPFQLAGLISEDIPDKKIYFNRLSDDWSLFPVCMNAVDFPTGQTVLLYDFDLEAGSIVDWRPEPNIVLFIDSIQLNDGSWRRTYHFTEDSSYYWIEGIGSNIGLLNSRANLMMTDVSCSLHCFRENNVLKYNTGNAVFCDSILVDAPEPRLDEQVYLYPNPAGGEVFLELPVDALPVRLRLFDPQGKLLKEEEINQIQTRLDVAPWRTAAMLAVHLQSAGGQQAIRMLRVE